MRNLLLALLPLTIVLLSCTQESPVPASTDTAASIAVTAPSPPQPDSSATNTSSTVPVQDQAATSVELSRGKEEGHIDYAWSGTGDSGSMNIRVENKTEREWSVEIETGTKLEPSDAAVQSMIVTSDVHVTMHPHQSQTVEVEVACLDISKDTPESSNDTWAVTASPRLATFIECIKRYNKNAVQEALWYYRGATREQWIDYFTTYQEKTPDEARQAADSVEGEIGELVRRCTP